MLNSVTHRFRRCLESGLRPELVKSGQSESRRLISPKPKVEEPVAEKELDIWESVMACHRLVLSQTAGISLMVVPTRVTVALAARIREEEDREGVVQEVLQVARIEHAFLTAKECIGFFNESLSREKMEVARQQGAYPALVFTAVQVRLSKITSHRQHSLLRVENSFVQVRCNQC